MMKAYTITESNEGHGVVEFAKHRIVALIAGANELGYDSSELRGLTCRRSPEYDEYASRGVIPYREMILNGWWFNCAHCGENIAELAEEENFDVFDIQGTQGGSPYCSTACHDRAQFEWHLTRNEEIKEIDRLRVEVEHRMPSGWEEGHHHVYIRLDGDTPIVHESHFHFRFPGQCYGTCKVEYKKGEEELKFTVPKGDIEKYYEWKEGPQ